MISESAPDGAGHRLRAAGGPETNLLLQLERQLVRLMQEGHEQGPSVLVEPEGAHATLEIQPLLGILLDQVLEVADAAIGLGQVLPALENVLAIGGDDLRQDQLTLQVLSIMDMLWKKEVLGRKSQSVVLTLCSSVVKCWACHVMTKSNHNLDCFTIFKHLQSVYMSHVCFRRISQNLEEEKICC